MNEETKKDEDLTKIQRKFGKYAAILGDGWTVFPNAILRYATELKLTPQEIVLILNVLSFQHTERKPYPSNKVIAERMGIKTRRLQKITEPLKDKEGKGILRRGDDKGHRSIWDFSPLYEKLLAFMERDGLLKTKETLGAPCMHLKNAPKETLGAPCMHPTLGAPCVPPKRTKKIKTKPALVVGTKVQNDPKTNPEDRLFKLKVDHPNKPEESLRAIARWQALLSNHKAGVELEFDVADKWTWGLPLHDVEQIVSDALKNARHPVQYIQAGVDRLKETLYPERPALKAIGEL